MNTYIKNFLKYRDFLIELIRKDIKIKYRNSVLGILWSMLNPLLVMIVLTIVFSSLFQKQIPNFPLYVLIGRVFYSFFAESTRFAMDSISANGQLIRKVYVPKYYFPLSRICSSFITFLLSMVVVFAVLLFSDIALSLVNFLIIIPLAYIFLIAFGAGLILASIATFFRDISHLYSVFLMLVMYTSAIFYPVDIIPDQYRMIVEYNPLFQVIDMARSLLINGSLPSLESHLVCLAYAVLSLIAGMFVFYKSQDRFIHYI